VTSSLAVFEAVIRKNQHIW